MIITFIALHAKETGKTVRVGWYGSTFNSTDQFGVVQHL